MSLKIFVMNSEVGTKLAAKKPYEKIEKGKVRLSNSMYMSNTDPNEVREIISNLKDKKSPGLDDISNEILKTSSELISKPISHIFDMAIEQGVFPKHLKEAKIIPVYKTGKKTNVSNYRPLSILSSVSKIFEKIIKKRLIPYLSRFDK